MLKRYLVFGGSDYYPAGGWGDFQNSYDTLEEAQWPKNHWGDKYDWCHVYDTQTGETLEVAENA